MTRPPLMLIVGAARSGKSRFALERAAALGLPQVFLATAEAGDEEMRLRIERHRRERGPGWRTIEEPLRIDEALNREAGCVVVVDCLTFWIANEIQGRSGGASHRTDLGGAGLESRIAAFEAALRERRSAIVCVTNEVGAGIVPENALARSYRDAVGLVNQRVAALADEVHAMVAGIPLRVK